MLFIPATSRPQVRNCEAGTKVKTLLFVIGLSLPPAGVAQAQDSLNVLLVGSCDAPGNGHGVAVGGDRAYVADDLAGLHMLQFYGDGVEETMNDERGTMDPLPTVVRGVLHLPASSAGSGAPSVLLGIGGRTVLDLGPRE
jgi:hypothetical protein